MSPSNDDFRTLPNNTEVERSLLGAMLLSPSAINRALEVLPGPEVFYEPSHRIIFQTILDMFERDQNVDAVTVAEELESQNRLEDAGGSSYLAELVNSVPSHAHAEEYAEVIHDKAVGRRLIETCTEIIEIAYDQTEDVSNLLDQAEQLIYNVQENRVNKGLDPLESIIKQTFEDLEQAMESDTTTMGLSTGFSDFDDMTSGLNENQLMIIAARPGMGKTSLALNIAQNVALEEEEPVALFSMEMSQTALAQRLLASESRVAYSKLQDGTISEREHRKVMNGLLRLGDAPIYLDDTANLSVRDIKAKALRRASESNLSLIIVDYLQLMQAPDTADSREQQVSTLSRGLKKIAMDMELPVIALAQLNRQPERRGSDKRPKLADLRGSGAIEQDADIVSFVYREYEYSGKEEDRGFAEWLLRKQRNGPTGTIELSFIDDYMRFEDMSREAPEGV